MTVVLAPTPDIAADTPTGSVRLTVLPGGALPPPESARRRWLLRGVALLALAVTVVYLTWRATATLNPAAWWVSAPMLLLEVHTFVSLGLFTFSLWQVDAQAPAAPVTETDLRVAVLIPTYNEPREVLLPTIAGAVALRPAHETWVLDDGERPWVQELAHALGARYLTRAEHTHAKAGNINHALNHIDVDIIAVLDADHVAAPGLLTRTLGYFADPRVALVQTPQDFYNLDSFEHDTRSVELARAANRELYHEQTLFYRVIQPGKNRWNAAFCCGTGALFRLAMLREIGGFATETITEDIHTTIRLHRRGWRTIYHNEVLARGLAAQTAAEYQLQRYRWGTGAMQVLRLENPLLVPGLTLAQRLCYATTLLGWFESWRSLGYLLLPPVVLLTGAMPIVAEPARFVPLYLFTLALQQIAMQALSRGHGRLFLATVFELVRMTPNLLATLTLLAPRRARFRVTPKGRLGHARTRVSAPPLLAAMLPLSGLALVWYLLSLAGLTPLRYAEPWVAHGAAFWLAVNLVLVVAAIRRVRAETFGAERRASVRFQTELAGTLDGVPCTIRDLSLTGARVVVDAGWWPALAVAAEHALAISALPTLPPLRGAVRMRRPARGGGEAIGLEFTGLDAAVQARLALALFNNQRAPVELGDAAAGPVAGDTARAPAA
jgi:cellulose synthase (UDP-forming)